MDGIIEIQLAGSDRIAVVDRASADLVQSVHWHARQCKWQTTAYAISSLGYMHRLILGLSTNDRQIVDHRDGDGLNNRRSNLRLATAQQNQWNRPKKRRLSGRNPDSGFKGVWWHRSVNKWAAGIRVENRNIHLGSFVDPKEAARIYDDAARKHFGEFARVNFPQPHEVGCII